MVVLAIAVVFNLVVGKLPSQYRNVDLSQTKLSTIGDTTKELVSNLDQDVTIYQIAESGSENETIQKLLERYEGLSSHVKVETMDPVLHPNFVSEYTDDDLASNSLLESLVFAKRAAQDMAKNVFSQTDDAADCEIGRASCRERV